MQPARGRYTQGLRLIKMIRELRAERLTAMQIARRHGVHWRTIRRDLDALSTAGVPVAEDDERRYWIER